jgi:hypothetical protein
VSRVPLKLALAVLAAFVSSACAAHDASLDSDPADALLSQRGWAALLGWDALPVFHSSTTRVFTSYEREGGAPSGFDPGNKDFNSFLALCGDRPALFDQQVDGTVSCQPGDAGYLIAAAEGPGFVSRLSITVGAFEPGPTADAAARFTTAPRQERIRIYVDDAAVYDGALADWASGSDPPFEAPLSGWSSGTTLSYVPISYAHSLRIFLDDLSTGLSAYYPHVTTHSSGATRNFDAAALSSAAARAQLAALTARATGSISAERWFDATLRLPAGATLPVWSRDRAGTVQRVQIGLATDTAREALADIVLSWYWDSELTPAIELPLAALFGAQQELSSFETWPMSVSVTPNTTTLSLRLPMPFAHKARVELAQRAGRERELSLRIDGVDTLPSAEYGRLHVGWALRDNPGAGERFVVADLVGRGKYVGTLMYMKGRKSLDFLEGDELLELDGSVNRGIGTEDYFGGGWYFWNGPFSSPFAALLHKRADADSGEAEITALRWHALSDAIDFRDALRLSFEYGPNMPATASEYAAVSFYYQ